MFARPIPRRTGVCPERVIVVPFDPHDRAHRPPAPGPRVHRRARSAERGYPPSVREIGEAVGLSSSSTVHAHLAALQDKGYLTRDPTKPRAIEVALRVRVGAAIERRPVRHVPLVGDVAAGTGVLAAENIEETMPVPEDFTGDGPAVHAPRARRLDDRRRHPRRRLRRRAPAAGRRRRRDRRRRHPRRGGDGQDLPASARQGRAAPREPRHATRWSSSPPTSRSTARSSRCSAASPRSRPPGRRGHHVAMP